MGWSMDRQGGLPRPAIPLTPVMGTGIASEQAINRLSERLAGFPSEQGNNREVSARASMSAKLLRP
jgi:hypothetical protein